MTDTSKAMVVDRHNDLDLLRAENSALRKALEAAPTPPSERSGYARDLAVQDYENWLATTCAEALARVKGETKQ